MEEDEPSDGEILMMGYVGYWFYKQWKEGKLDDVIKDIEKRKN